MPLLHYIRPACLLSVLALMLAGCAGKPLVPAARLQPGAHVGFLVETGDRPIHTHYEAMGASSVRSAAAYSYDWRLDGAVAEIVQRELSLGGFVATDLERQGLRHADLAALPDAGQGTVNPLHARLREQGVRAVVLVRDARVLANQSCADGPCERIAEGPGVYSSTANGVTSWRAVAAFDWQVFLLDPPANLAEVPPLRESLRMPSELLLGSSRPRGTGEADLLPVREKVLEYVEAVSEDVVLALGGRRAGHRMEMTAAPAAGAARTTALPGP